MSQVVFRRDREETGPPIPSLIGSGPAMQEVYRLTRQVARSNASVLLLGETGTGKELIAKAIHARHAAAARSFASIAARWPKISSKASCSAMFARVHRRRDESNWPLRSGPHRHRLSRRDQLDDGKARKTTRVLQEHEFERVGDRRQSMSTPADRRQQPRPVEEVEAQRFREDLYYRPNVITIYLPPPASARTSPS